MSSGSDIEDSQDVFPIVLDIGESQTRAGYAALGDPDVVIPSIIGRPQPFTFGVYDLQDMYIGKEAEDKLPFLSFNSPVKRGAVNNWEDLEEILIHTFSTLEAEPEEHPILWAEHAFPPKSYQEKLAEVMFETFAIPSMYIGMEAALSLYSMGKTCGLVLASGDGITHTVPIYDGYASEHSIERFPVGGKDITEYLSRLLRERGYAFSSSSEMHLLKYLKEETAFVTTNYAESIEMPDSIYEKNCTLPDGQEIEIGNERFRCAEAMFNPSLIGKGIGGVHKMLYDTFDTCDVDVKSYLYNNVVLSGGNTLFSGMQERIEQELNYLSPSYKTFHVHSHPDKELGVWRGGSILANLPTFPSMCTTSEEYFEEGPEVLNSD